MKKLIRTFIMIISVYAGITAAAGDQNAVVTLVDQPCERGTGISIYVSKEGEVIANEETTSVETLANRLEATKTTVSEVCYSREDPENSEPHPNAIKVLDLIVATQLPVAFYWDKGFTKRIEF